MFVAITAGHDRQRFWICIVLLKNKLFVTNLLWFLIHKNIFKMTIVNAWQLGAELWKFLIFWFPHFLWLIFWKWEYIVQNYIIVIVVFIAPFGLCFCLFIAELSVSNNSWCITKPFGVSFSAHVCPYILFQYFHWKISQPQNIHLGHILFKCPILTFCNFPRLTFWKWSEAVYPQIFTVNITVCFEYIRLQNSVIWSKQGTIENGLLVEFVSLMISFAEIGSNFRFWALWWEVNTVWSNLCIGNFLCMS